ncbi:hypothetical protein KQX54_019986 [Cotesia glomerata]|uniref:Uncharacterized protein n=1 Tax=Cotesia glomerata TaxID=32391 RepID=A0AAV7IPG5_COTGL|nr:hypothetical protein KQX54_019986 [Cotesia glomerata]
MQNLTVSIVMYGTVWDVFNRESYSNTSSSKNSKKHEHQQSPHMYRLCEHTILLKTTWASLAFPIIWALSSDYTSATVGSIVYEIHSILTSLNAAFGKIYTDCFYDLAEAVDQKFSGKYEKSFDSYCQVLHAVADKIVNEKTIETDGALKKIMTFSLLPHNQIEPEFKKFKEDLTEELKNNLEELLTYYESK